MGVSFITSDLIVQEQVILALWHTLENTVCVSTRMCVPYCQGGYHCFFCQKVEVCHSRVKQV